MKKEFEINRSPAISGPDRPAAGYSAAASLPGSAGTGSIDNPPAAESGTTGIAAKSTAVAGADTAAEGATDGSTAGYGDAHPTDGSTAVNDSAAALSQGATDSGSTGSTDLGTGTAPTGFRVSVGYATAAAEEISGDTAISSGLPDGSLALILSDGMGKGIRAAALSRIVASRLRKNLKGGMAPANAIKEVNAYMLTHRQTEGEGENFATVDLLLIDRTTEKAKFYKMGAATSFVLRDGKVKMLEKAALPIGIVPKVRSSQISERLRPGDIVIMVSDGITEAARGAAVPSQPSQGGEAAGPAAVPSQPSQSAEAAELAAIPSQPTQGVDVRGATGVETGGGAGEDAGEGAGGIDGTWLRELLEAGGAGSVDFSGMTSRRLARWILDEAVAKYADRERDDLTVAVVKIV